MVELGVCLDNELEGLEDKCCYFLVWIGGGNRRVVFNLLYEI